MEFGEEVVTGQGRPGPSIFASNRYTTLSELYLDLDTQPYKFVHTADGLVVDRVAPEHPEVHHQMLADNEPVFMAGEVYCEGDSVIFTNQSGHYQATPGEFMSWATRFAPNGIVRGTDDPDIKTLQVAVSEEFQRGGYAQILPKELETHEMSGMRADMRDLRHTPGSIEKRPIPTTLQTR
jgi:hypothetical protein